MYIVGVIFALVVVICQVIDVFLIKHIMTKVEPKENALYRIMFVTPVLLIAAMLNWHITSEAWLWIVLYSVAEAINILTYCMALNKTETTLIYLISKVDLIFVLVVGYITGFETVTFLHILSMVVFITGIMLVMGIKTGKGSFKSDITAVQGIGLMVISAMGRTFKSYSIKHIMESNYASNETILVVSMVISFILIYLYVRPKISLNRERIRYYSMQSIIMGVTMISIGYAILYAGVVTFSVIAASSIIMVAILNSIIYKEKLTKHKIIGIVLAFMGLVYLT